MQLGPEMRKFALKRCHVTLMRVAELGQCLLEFRNLPITVFNLPLALGHLTFECRRSVLAHFHVAESGVAAFVPFAGQDRGRMPRSRDQRSRHVFHCFLRVSSTTLRARGSAKSGALTFWPESTLLNSSALAAACPLRGHPVVRGPD